MHGQPMSSIRNVLWTSLGPGIGVGVTDPTAPDGDLLPEERPATARMVDKRRLEFTAGRIAARAAMAELGLPAAPILMAPDRAPVWPAGLVGSIAHTATACIAAVAPVSAARSIGLDIEDATPLAPDLWDIVLTQTEQNWVQTQPDPGMAAKQIFSAKEAVYKAQYPLTGTVLEFRDVEVSPALETFSAVFSGQTATGACHRADQLIVSLVRLV